MKKFSRGIKDLACKCRITQNNNKGNKDLDGKKEGQKKYGGTKNSIRDLFYLRYFVHKVDEPENVHTDFKSYY